jgi:hypothetical protein
MPVSVRIVTSIYTGCNHNDKTWNGYHYIEEAARNTGFPVTVYEKDNSLPFMTSVETDRVPPGGGRVIGLDNTYGSCDYAFLYHIYSNYDSLDDVTIFTKVNMLHGGIPVESFRAFVREADRWDFSDIGAHPLRGVWNLGLHYKNHQHIEFMYAEPSNRDPIWYRSSDWYDHIFGGTPFPTTTCDVWGHGPCFSVSKKLILRHPRSVYKYLIDSYLSPYNRNDDKYNINITHDLFTRFWKLLFTHNIACRLKPVPHSFIEPNHEPLPEGAKWTKTDDEEDIYNKRVLTYV